NRGSMQIIFWISVALILYVYIGYPLLLALVRHNKPGGVRKAGFEPTVTIVIAAYNERGRIERKLQNCIELDYPSTKLQIAVSLDGPTDGTDLVVCKYANYGVEIVHSKTHRGKPAALNAGVQHASGDIVVFADARQIFDRNAIRRLVETFVDSDVGAVS